MMPKKIKKILVVFISLLFLNYLSQRFYKRFDLTIDQRYTISKTSINILNKVQKTLHINVYLEGQFPSEFQRLQFETRQFLEELKFKNANIKVHFINPDSMKDRLIKKGMKPSILSIEEDGGFSESIIFPWAELKYGKKTILVSLLPNTKTNQLQSAIENLEFLFSNAIQTLVQKQQQKIAILTGNGQLKDIKLYSFLSEVSKKYRLAKFTLDSVATNPLQTLKDLQNFDLAIIAKPSEKFSSEEKFTIDQFMMHGGKLLWMIDNVQADQDSLFANGKMLAYPRDLNITDQLFSYGVRINTNLIKDVYASKIPLATGNIGGSPQFKNLDWFFHPLVGGNPYHPISKNVAPIRIQFATHIDTIKNNIKKTPLLVSSVNTKTVGTPTIISLDDMKQQPIEKEYQSGNQLFAILLEGQFTSAFENRIRPFKTTNFTSISKPNKMIVISDGDIAKNQILKGKPHDLSYDKWTNQQFGNKIFLLNTINYLLDDSGLIHLRNKTLQLAHLDKQKAYSERLYWQCINIIFPLLLLGLFGYVFNFLRKKKYTTI